MDDRQLILGSASPRRADLLRAAGIAFTVKTADVDEGALYEDDTDIVVAVSRIAQAKFGAFAASSAMLLTADTLVACNGRLLGKPQSAKHLTDMLGDMSGQPIEVVTAVCLGSAGAMPQTQTVQTTVHLRTLHPDEIATYVATGVGLDKAGGLALQAEAGSFIAAVDGCWSNVLGLPVCIVADMVGQPWRPSLCQVPTSTVP